MSQDRQTAAASDALPARIGVRYDVLSRLGRGGMAVVYRVRDRSSPGELALKQLVLSGSVRDRETRALFEREFQVLSQLRHPNLVGVHDYGVDASGPYYTMDLLDGGDLSTGAPWPFRDACQAMMQVCSLLSLLHARGFVHRDITPRNVRLTPDASAKLIDFGAMVPFGPCLQAVGTPGFTAPEVVHHLRLDARTDLFSVGATLYYALTGQRPFTARTLAELGDAWRREPAPASALVPGIPGVLDALISSLLQMDPARRPNSAFEVMQRLSALSGKPLADSAEVARAYLSTPLLIGRESQSRRFRQGMQRAVHGDGGGMLFEGPSGSGRSRLLAACALEAQTTGAIVLRAGGRAARPEAFACALLLAEQLVAALPDDASAQAAEIGVAERLFSAVGQLRSASEWAADPAAIQAALQQWFKRACRSQALVIAVDDVEYIDSASLALLLALVSDAEGARLLVLSALQSPLDIEARRDLVVLKSYSITHDLPPLDVQQTEQLFATIFANAPRTALLSDRVHKLAAGNPRAAMTLVQHMLERALIRYADGNWILPAELEVGDLPASGQDALRIQIEKLPELARRVARAQALALEGPWRRSDYAAVLPDQPQLGDAALAELMRQGLVVEAAGSYALVHPDLRVCLTQPLTAAERTAGHQELASWCSRTGRWQLIEAYHWLAGDCAGRGLDCLAELGASLENQPEPRVLGMDYRVAAATVERALQLSKSMGRPARETCDLARWLLPLSVVVDDEIFHRHAASLLQQLERDSGLTDYRELSGLTNSQERLQRALTAAAERYENTPERQRVFRVDLAIKLIANYVVISIVTGSRTRDTRLLASLPELLEPFAPLSPALHALWQNAIGVNEITWMARLEQARARWIAVYRSLEHVADREVPYANEIRGAIAYAAAGIEVHLGYPSAEAWIALIEDDPLHHVSAQYLHRQLSIHDGDLQAAERYRKRAELFAAQAMSRQMFEASPANELFLQMQLRDLAGVKHAADRIGLLAARWPGWRPLHELAQGYYHHLRGDLLAALAAFERTAAIDEREPSDRPASEVIHVAAAEGCMGVLAELGQLEAARERGLLLVRRCEELEITCNPTYVRVLAVIEARLGDCDRATARLDALLARHENRRPSYVALDCEARARVAILAGDAAAASRYMRLALEHGAADGATGRLAMRGRLLDEAQKQGLDLDIPRSSFESTLEAQSTPRAVAQQLNDALRAELAHSLEPAARAQRALQLLCRELKASGGQLYFARGTEMTRAAALSEPDKALDHFARGYWQQRQLNASMTTIFTAPEQTAGLASGTWTSPSGKQYALLLLSPGGEAESVGLAALLARPEIISAEYWALSAAISGWLQELGDI